MADKNFGIKRFNLIGASGTPTISSPNNINLNATQVSISTDLSIGGQVVSNVLVGSLYSVGIGTTVARTTLDVRGSASITGVTTLTTLTAGNTVISGITTVGVVTASSVGIGTTNALDTLTVLGRVQIQQNASSNSRLVFRAVPGNAYRWSIDNDSSNNFRIFREDDVTAASGTVPFQISTAGNATLSGNFSSAGNYYVKLGRTSNQTITASTDTFIGFSAVSDPNSWWNSGTNRITPTVAGNYYMCAMVHWQAGVKWNDQNNLQLRKNTTTFALSQIGIQTNHPYTQTVYGIVSLNGSSDYVDLTVYTANTTSQAVTGTANGDWTKLELFKLN